ncbi:MAG: hypothetical protein HY940_10455 [Gammaproteobacteria bacterium]|nr:hypothetical protein [Gammaproteobacteria bacterium]
MPIPDHRHVIRRLLVLLTLTVAGTHAAAAEPGRFFGLGAETFLWQEFSSSGGRYLQEQGARLVLDAGVERVLNSGDRLQLGGHAYFGNINYDGQTQAGVPALSTTNYLGGQLYLSDHRPLPLSWHTWQPGLLAVLGLDQWSRIIADTVDQNGQPVGGAEEVYRILYSDLGLTLQQTGASSHHLTISAGLRLPLWTWEEYRALRLILAPTPDVSLFATADMSLPWPGQQLRLYYQGWRFGASDVVQGYLQPESHADAFGISFITRR